MTKRSQVINRLRWLLLTVCVVGLLPGFGMAANASAPLPLWQRVLLGGELKSFNPQAAPPVLLNRKQFIQQAEPSFVLITPKSALRELTTDAFKAATIITLRNGNKSLLVASTVIQAGSSAKARRIAAWSSFDGLQPCRTTCDVRIEPFDVSGIPGAKGVRRFRDRVVAKESLFESYDIVYADGPFVYDIFTLGPKLGTFNKSELIAAARRQYDRVKGSGPPALAAV